MTGMEDGEVTLRGSGGRSLALPLDVAARFQVYDPRVLNVAAGDLVRITHKGKTLDGHVMENGGTYTRGGFYPARQSPAVERLGSGPGLRAYRLAGFTARRMRPREKPWTGC